MIYGRLGLLDGSNIVASAMVMFHDFSLVLLITILSSVLFMFYICFRRQKYVVKLTDSSNYLEIIWTVLPMFFLLSLGMPSFLLIYYLEGEINGDLTYNTISHQWYWSYENDDFGSYQFDSYMVQESDLSNSDSRLLEVDNSLVLPMATNVRLIVSSTDVLHSWALPNIAVNIDAVPGRLNSLNLYSSTPSSFYSQCSEICGINHSFMPINVEFVSWSAFINNFSSLPSSISVCESGCFSGNLWSVFS